VVNASEAGGDLMQANSVPGASPRGDAGGRSGEDVTQSRASAPAATSITFPPSLDCEFSRFLLAHYGVHYAERRHVLPFSFLHTLWHGGTLHFPLLYSDSYRLDTVRKMIDYFDPLCPADRNLLLAAPDRTRVEADWEEFNHTLGGATTAFAYFHLLPHRAIMIRPLSEGTPGYEVFAVRHAYPLFAALLRKALRLSDSGAAAALEQIRTVVKSVDDRLADGRRYLIGERFSLSDMAFAVALAPLVAPDLYGGPVPTLSEMPPVLQSVNAELRARPAGEFARRIYRDHRRRTP
jgi:glutathione S-transferase